MPNNHKLSAKGIEVKTSTKSDTNHLCLTDIAKYKNAERPDELIRNWLRNRNTIEFLGIWEQLNNELFNPVEFDRVKNYTDFNAPRGQLYVSLGQRPRNASPQHAAALKGRSKAMGIRAPFQGLTYLWDRIPRVLPWADIDDTVGVFLNNPTPKTNINGVANPRPNGAFYVSLGQRPRNASPQHTVALKGRSKVTGDRAPFQGLTCLWDRIPRVLPWADIGDTVGVFLTPNLKLAS